MAYKYNKTLLIGATSGIGEAYAEKVVQAGKKVIIVGRRKENLDAFVSKHGKDKAEALQFDITNLAEIPSFVQNVTKSNPDLDCIIINSGIQRGFDFSKPESIDLDLIGSEFTTNYLSYIHLTTAFLPFLQKQQHETALAYTSSGLALAPILRCPNYCASKAALHHFTLTLREQLKGGNVKIIEIFPPAVQTELHDEKHQPDIKNGRSMGMPLKEFIEKSWAKLCQGEDQIPIGLSEMYWNGFETKRQEMFQHTVQMMKGQK